MKMNGGVGVQIHTFDLGFSEDDWTVSRLGRFSSGQMDQSDRRLDGPYVGLDVVGKRNFLALPGLEFRPVGHPTCVQSTELTRSFLL
jgi:hypothetical protein